MFFFAFLPQFVGTGPGSVPAMLRLGGVFMLVTLVVFAGYGVFAAGVRDQVLGRPRVTTWLRRAFAGSYLAFAARLAVANR